jgi:hypothetical protein
MYALGWYSGSKQFQGVDDLSINLDGYMRNGIPLEGMWIGHNYMSDFKDFTVDTSGTFGDLSTISNLVYERYGIETILQFDSGLSSETNTTDFASFLYGKALENNLLINSTINKDLEHGKLT